MRVWNSQVIPSHTYIPVWGDDDIGFLQLLQGGVDVSLHTGPDIPKLVTRLVFPNWSPNTDQGQCCLTLLI